MEWHQISGAKAIIETDLDEVPVTPSEGTHFFQNITSFGIGYFNVNRREGGGFVDYRMARLTVGRSEETPISGTCELDQPLGSLGRRPITEGAGPAARSLRVRLLAH